MTMNPYDVIVVGSGAGGAALARDLSLDGRKVLVIEKGRKEEKLGTFKDALRYFDGNPTTKMPRKSREGHIIYRSFMAGGSTVVATGNMTRCLEEELGNVGIDLSEELQTAEHEMGVAPIDPGLLSEKSRQLQAAAKSIGYHLDPMPKAIDAAKCRRCGKCSLGCAYGAKWTSRQYLQEAEDHGAELLLGAEVEKVLVENGHATGVRLHHPNPLTVTADTVVLAAGGLGTPVILKGSGIDQAGDQLFADLLVTVYGLDPMKVQDSEPQMALVDLEFHKKERFILSPFVQAAYPVRMIETGGRGAATSASSLLGIMVKIADESVGQIYADGSYSKAPTDTDQDILEQGIYRAKELLLAADVDPKSIIVSKVAGGHPGGTAAIDRVVDRHLMTGIKGLYVCDASVLPRSPGMPPILTITALAKWLGKRLH
ncbi:MAG: FAD-dependent oxidoreductase [Bacillota bacterium]|nr:FAD-dependent oxidoreductase [Bacillota bacterium]MDW7678780.1 FAD-dependent oxidoreductase [Bacillota bacterium]